MVISVCVNAPSIYVNIEKLIWFIMCFFFFFFFFFIISCIWCYQHITKIQNIFHYFNRLVYYIISRNEITAFKCTFKLKR